MKNRLVVMVKLKIARMHDKACWPEFKTEGAACFDVASCAEGNIGPGEIMLVHTGLIFEIPEGYCLEVYPRSGYGSKGLTMANCVGIIDSDYRGELIIPMVNLWGLSRYDPIINPTTGEHGGWYNVQEHFWVEKNTGVPIPALEFDPTTLPEDSPLKPEDFDLEAMPVNFPIVPGTRVAQAKMVKLEKYELQKCELGGINKDTVRDTSGFGSTGK